MTNINNDKPLGTLFVNRLSQLPIELRKPYRTRYEDLFILAKVMQRAELVYIVLTSDTRTALQGAIDEVTRTVNSNTQPAATV
jgi:hypothetical protein